MAAATTPTTTPATLSGSTFRISRMLGGGVVGAALAYVSCVGYQRYYKIPDAGTRFLARWCAGTAGSLCGSVAHTCYLNEDHKEGVLWGVVAPVVAGCLVAHAISPGPQPNAGASDGTR